jgi:hypothetical protein
MSKNVKSNTPITNLVVNWVILHTPASILDAIKAGAASITMEQEGFVRNGNRTDHRRADGTHDPEAFASAKVEQSIHGDYILNYSTMLGRRADDIVRAVLDHLSTVIFPPVPQANTKTDGTPKMNTRPGEREKWMKSLGFGQVDIGAGKRWQLSLAGSDELITAINELVPEVFKGTEKPSSTKVQVAFATSNRTNGTTAYVSLYNPAAEGVDVTKFGLDVAKVRLLLVDGWSFNTVSVKGEKVLPEVAEQYLAALNAAEPVAQPQIEAVA